ncbi:SapC protein [Sphingomonas gellani]|uniref:SapC protein n=1 Tax=Sphingomonas gellani TaxID=1166340 RepID=A0A1H8GP77_9SPHN|nr:SapC family protein [Sphingomonas gellani]SEN45544.1 SapC protein [Sphingomonas gellani]
MPDHAILTPATHADTRIRQDRSADMGDAIMSCLVVPDEFRRVQNDYVILFRRNLEDGSMVALALFGFENGENLYLEQGTWNAGYVPLAMAIQPLLIGSAPSGTQGGQVHIDMASPRLSDGEGERLFDADGRPTPFLDARIEKLGALDVGFRASAAFFAALQRYDLLEPLTLEVPLDDGSTNRLVGFHVIDEDRLRALDGSEVADLHREGHLMPIFMALASQGNLSELIGRKNKTLRHG